jgi:ubiquinol-cytochrome c reductase cytochrome c1 subunit
VTPWRLTLAGCILTLSAVQALAAPRMPLLEPHIELDNRATLQRGAALFVNYCVSCHGASFMRYSRMGEDLGLTDEQVRRNLMFAAEKIGDPMAVAMHGDDAIRWFGIQPPDLSVIARARGADWLYTYLLTFYHDPDPKRPFGVNNLVFPEVGMPHVLWELQGVQLLHRAERPEKSKGERVLAFSPTDDGFAILKEIETADGKRDRVVDQLKVETAGSMAPGEFRRAMRDLVSFLVYLGEPAKMERHRVGGWVLLFIFLFTILSYALYREYWKDVH